jgi:hypothetical protein
MFARQPPPRLRLAVQRDRTVGLITIFVCNRGRGLAEDVLLRLTIDAQESDRPLVVDRVGPFWHQTAQMGVQKLEHNLQRDSMVIHAHDVSEAISFKDIPFQAPNLIVQARIDARGMRPVEIETTISRLSTDFTEVRARADE